MAHEVIDNFLIPVEYKRIHDSLLRPQMLWYMAPEFLELSQVDKEKTEKGSIYFTHTTYNAHEVQSELFTAFNAAYEALKAKSIVQSYVNFYPYSGKQIEYPPTPNMVRFKCKEAIYFCNDTDAVIKFSDGTEVQGLGNRVVIIDENDTTTYVSPTNRHYGATLVIKYLD